MNPSYYKWFHSNGVQHYIVKCDGADWYFIPANKGEILDRSNKWQRILGYNMCKERLTKMDDDEAFCTIL